VIVQVPALGMVGNEAFTDTFVVVEDPLPPPWQPKKNSAAASAIEAETGLRLRASLGWE